MLHTLWKSWYFFILFLFFTLFWWHMICWIFALTSITAMDTDILVVQLLMVLELLLFYCCCACQSVENASHKLKIIYTISIRLFLVHVEIGYFGLLSLPAYEMCIGHSNNNTENIILMRTWIVSIDFPVSLPPFTECCCCIKYYVRHIIHYVYSKCMSMFVCVCVLVNFRFW